MTTTIFAPATGAGRAAIAIVRLSGPATASALLALAGPLPAPRFAALRTLRDPVSRTPLDRGLVLWFPAPASFTGEDCAELHLHGGRAVLTAVLAALGAVPGCRLAEPGAFTQRAFRNGRMDLPAVEGLADLIDAETEAQRRQALRQHDGALGEWVAAQREILLGALAAAESAIDFSDEADVAGDFLHEVQRRAEALATAIGEELRRGARAAHVRDGFVVALTGPPNAGKSTLINALARRAVAIVSPYPGTTRDPIEVQLDLDGYLVHVVDTAGVRDTDDPVETLGIARTLERAGAADLVLWLADAAAPQEPDPALTGTRLLRVATKLDLVAQRPAAGEVDFGIAATTGEGLPALVAAFTDRVDTQLAGDAGVVTRQRHRDALLDAEAALAAITVAGDALSIELAAEHLRHVAACLDRVMGRIDTDEILGAIFARFCIGK